VRHDAKEAIMPNPHPPSAEPAAAASAAFLRPGHVLSATRTDMLRTMLPHTIECLKARQAHLIGDDLIDDYVALDWLEWAGGGLRLTEIGRNVSNGLLRRSG
jgi:hypothetical protein